MHLCRVSNNLFVLKNVPNIFLKKNTKIDLLSVYYWHIGLLLVFSLHIHTVYFTVCMLVYCSYTYYHAHISHIPLYSTSARVFCKSHYNIMYVNLLLLSPIIYYSKNRLNCEILSTSGANYTHIGILLKP